MMTSGKMIPELISAADEFAVLSRGGGSDLHISH
jgi:hypothetical protein